MFFRKARYRSKFYKPNPIFPPISIIKSQLYSEKQTNLPDFWLGNFWWKVVLIATDLWYTLGLAVVSDTMAASPPVTNYWFIFALRFLEDLEAISFLSLSKQFIYLSVSHRHSPHGKISLTPPWTSKNFPIILHNGANYKCTVTLCQQGNCLIQVLP